jgi:tetratricopeptide (TPR) repeat protein
LADINRAIELAGGISSFHVFRGQLFARKKNYQKAHADLTEAIRLSSEPQKSYVYRERGDLELAQSRFDPAVADFTKAIRYDRQMAETKDVASFSLRARAYLASGANEKAIADCDAALKINPNATWILNVRGIALARQRQWDRAIADLAEEVKRQPHNRANLLATQACALALAGRFDQAASLFSEAAHGEPGFVRSVLACRGWYLDRLRGNFDDALENLKLAENRVWPANTFLYRGMLYARLGDPERALADFKTLAEIIDDRRADFFAIADFFPRRLGFLLGRGEAYLQKGDLEHAWADADEAVRFAPGSAEARLLRAEVSAKRGQNDLAEADRRAAAGLAPDPIIYSPKR